MLWRAIAFFPLVCSGQDFTSYKVDAVSTAHKFLEGPVWSARDTILLFSDIPSNQIWKLDTKGQAVFRADSQGANGSAFDDKGRLYICEGRSRRVTRLDKKGNVEVVADQFEGKKLNGPNDITVTKHDHVYFTDPAFGSAQEGKELPFYGVFRVPSKGPVVLALKFATRPNGIASSPDGNTLYVSFSDERRVRAYDIAKDGGLSNERVLVDKVDGVPDGVETDEKGNVYVAAGKLNVYSPKGELLGQIELREKPSNMTFGDGDLKSLYVTARSTLYRIRLDVKGVALY